MRTWKCSLVDSICQNTFVRVQSDENSNERPQFIHDIFHTLNCPSPNNSGPIAQFVKDRTGKAANMASNSVYFQLP